MRQEVKIMEGNTVEYTPSELVSAVQEGFAGIYKPFANYPYKQHPLWQKCIETISDAVTLDRIIFCNDVLSLPPVRVFLCLHPELIEDKNLTACDKKFVGSFFSYIFTSIFCYKHKKQVSTRSPCIKTALRFYDRPEGIAIIQEKKESKAAINKPLKEEKIKSKKEAPSK